MSPTPTPWAEIKIGDEFVMNGRRQRVTSVTPAGHDGVVEGFTITAVDAEISERLTLLPWYFAQEEKP